MFMKSQRQVWNSIAKEWFEFRNNPIMQVVAFLKKEKGKVLDLGSGAGRHLMKIKNGRMYLADFSDEMIVLAKRKAKEKKINAEFFVSLMTELSFEDNFFDAGICIDSLHCVEGAENRKKVVRKLFRVLKPGAEAMISVWNKNSRRFKNSPKEKCIKWRDKGERYYYLFDEDEIYNLFERAGFKIKKKIGTRENIDFIVEKPRNFHLF